MGVGIGGLITGLMAGDPSAQLGQALAGPSPNPQPMTGGAQSPSGAPGPAGAPPGVNAPPQAPALPPAQAYAPDPANASTIALLLKVHQQDMASNDINRNVQLMSSGFGTAQQQHDKMALVNSAGEGGGDTLGALGQIQKLQSGQLELENKQRFQASADLLGQTFGLKPGQGGMLSSDPDLFNSIIQSKVKDTSLTDQEKMVRDWEASALKSGVSPQEIQQQKTMLLGGMVGGQTPDQKNMNRDIALWQQQNPGKSPQEMLAEHPEYDSVAGYVAAKGEAAKNAIASSKDRLDSKSALPDVEKTLAPINSNIDTLLDPANLPHVIAAIKAPDLATTGQLGALAGRMGVVDPKTLEMKNAVTQLQGQLSGDAMHSQKNIRTQREFNAITAGASPIFSPTATPEQITAGLQQLKAKFGLAHANAIAAAGGEVPAEYADKVDKDYLTPGGALYNGATIAKPPAPSQGDALKQLSADDLTQAKTLMAQHGRDAVINHLKAKGYDTSGL